MTDELKVESVLQEAFGADEPPPKAIGADVPDPVAEDVAEAEAAAEAAPDEPTEEAAPEEQAAVEAEPPELEIEVDGERFTVKGADQFKELLQKVAHYSKRMDSIARQQESLVAQAQLLQQREQFQTHIMADVAELRSLDAQLEHYGRINWAEAFDSDPFNALKLREQRDQLREQRSAKFNEIN